MRMQTKRFRIGALAKELGVEKFVIRFWEKEFGLKGYRSDGGQRFYNEKDVDTFKAIKHLLYEDGFTIAGAKQQLSEKRSFKGSTKAHDTDTKNSQELPKDFSRRIVQLQKKLVKLRELL